MRMNGSVRQMHYTVLQCFARSTFDNHNLYSVLNTRAYLRKNINIKIWHKPPQDVEFSSFRTYVRTAHRGKEAFRAIYTANLYTQLTPYTVNKRRSVTGSKFNYGLASIYVFVVGRLNLIRIFGNILVYYFNNKKMFHRWWPSTSTNSINAFLYTKPKRISCRRILKKIGLFPIETYKCLLDLFYTAE